MKLFEALKLALQSLWANKLRSVLTLIGVVMGVASVIMMITLVNGANHFVATKLSGYGADVFTVSQTPSVIFSAEEYMRFQKRRKILPEDFRAVAENCRDCREVGAGASQTKSVSLNGKSADRVEVRGYTPDMLPLNNIDIAMGRAFTAFDDERGTHNAIIGYDIVDNLIGNGDPVGQEIRVDGVPYTVVGVGERQGKMLGQSQDNWVAVPLTTYLQTYGSNQTLTIYVRAGEGAGAMDRAEDQVRVLMRTRRHDAPGAPDSFELETNDTFLDIWKSLSSVIGVVIVGIASIALVVGGIVIMNIMLVSVSERTREIGVRKALGARQRDVLVQFLIESATMSLAGGVVGVGIGVAVAKTIESVFGFPANVSLGSVLLGLGMATGVGIFFGVYPARTAARLDPIVALRSEM